MIRLMQDDLSNAQRERLARFRTAQCVDIHCHCLPGLDDGPPAMDDALALCRALVGDGVTTVVATPHQLGRFDGQFTAQDIRQAVDDLNRALEADGVPLTVVPGADVRIDERIPSLLEADRLLTLADGGEHLLLELPHDTFIDPCALIGELTARGVRVILSHPERNAFLTRQPLAAAPWLARGAWFQVTAASLVGDFGPVSERAAWYWLTTHAAALVATDAHDTDFRRPRMSEAVDRIAERLGHVAARRVCIENPLRVLAGEELSPLPGPAGAGGRE